MHPRKPRASMGSLRQEGNLGFPRTGAVARALFAVNSSKSGKGFFIKERPSWRQATAHVFKEVSFEFLKRFSVTVQHMTVHKASRCRMKRELRVSNQQSALKTPALSFLHRY